MGHPTRARALETAGLLHPHPEAVRASLFSSGCPFFLAADKVQVKYEMLRAHFVDGVQVTSCASSHGYSRAAFYLASFALHEQGLRGLLDDPRGRKGPTKIAGPVATFLRTADATRSGAELAAEIEARFGVTLHRRTVERARR